MVYVDDLVMTSSNKDAVLETEALLRGVYGQFRTTTGTVFSYLECTWGYGTMGVVKIGREDMMQVLVSS